MTILSDIVYREMCAVAWTNKLSIIWTVLIYSIFIFKVKIVQLSLTKNEKKIIIHNIHILLHVWRNLRRAISKCDCSKAWHSFGYYFNWKNRLTDTNATFLACNRTYFFRQTKCYDIWNCIHKFNGKIKTLK